MPSYEQRKSSKKWSVRFREINEQGKETNKRLSGFDTKREAQAAYHKYLQDKELAEKEKRLAATNDSSITFYELRTLYIKHQETRVKPSSIYSFRSLLEKHIAPIFDDKTIENIKPIDIVRWQSSLSSYSFKYRKNLNGLLTAILRFGERYYDTPNIMNKVEPLRNTEAKKEMLFWTPEEFKKFISVSDDYAFTVFFKFLYISGARKGEALALQWETDFLPEEGCVKISKSITRKVTGEAWSITTPKNESSNRKVYLPQHLIEELQAYRKWQIEIEKDPTFLFCGERPFPERNIDRYFEKCCALAEVKKIRIHDLRHSCASLLISKGASIVSVSKRLGHKDIEQTLNTYSHLMPSDQEKILQIFNEF